MVVTYVTWVYTYTQGGGLLPHTKTGRIIDQVEPGRIILLFDDDFGEGNPAGRFGLDYPPPDAYPGWTVVQGNWIIEDNYLKNLWGPDKIILNSPSSEVGKTIRTKVLENYHGIYPQLILGYQDLNNYYGLVFSWGYGWGGSKGWIKIYQVVDGVSTDLAQTESSIQLEQSQGYWIEFRWASPTELEGEIWDLDWSSLAAVEATITDEWTTGNYGLASTRGTSHAWFDDMQIRNSG